jgi:glycosyltransferase involved in cell wall biosynthesis
MKILYLNTLYDPYVVGGAERVLQAQVEAMHQAGHEVAVLSLDREPGMRRATVNGIPIWRAGIQNVYFHFDEIAQRRAGTLRHAAWHLLDSYNFAMKFYVSKVAKEFSPEVACCHNLVGWSISAWDALSDLNIPIVQVLHDQYLLCASSAMFRNGQRCMSICTACRALRLPHRRRSGHVDTLVGVSRFITSKLVGQGYFCGVRSIKTIPNILDIASEAVPTSPRADDGNTVFGYIGRLSPEKGIELLLNTFRAARQKEWRLRIGGSGEAAYEARLKNEFRDSGIEFVGRTSRSDFFPSVDISVIPSLWEDTFPSVAYESIVYGVPVLGSDIGGIPEIVNSRNGMLFAPGNPSSLTRALEDAAGKLAEFRGRFHLIQQDAIQFRDKERWLKQWSDVYADAVTHRDSTV